MSPSLCAAVFELPAATGGLSLGVSLGEQRFASLTADARALGTLQAELGMSRHDVHAAAAATLGARRGRDLPAVLLTPPRAVAPRLERFASLYFHTAGDHTFAGCVWFDVASSTTGPSDVSNVVRNQMRFLVNRSLSRTSVSPRLIDALLRWDAVRLEEAPAAHPIGADAARWTLGMTLLERFDDTHGSVRIGWLAPQVLYARFAGAISLALGLEYVRRLRILVAAHEGVRYFADYSAIQAYDVGVFPSVLAALKELASRFVRITVRPWATAPTATARSRLDAFSCIEYVTSAGEFDARLRAAAPGASLWGALEESTMHSHPAAGAAAEDAVASPPEAIERHGGWRG